MPTSPASHTLDISGHSWPVPSWISGKSGLAAVLAVLGLATIWTSMRMLWSLWTTDALKSIGMIVPVVSFVLVLRAWRSMDWELDGSWWGFALLLGTALLVRVRDQAVMVLELGFWNVYFPPHSLVLLAYGVGVTWLFGGWRLVRASAFPLLFLLLVNPVPHIFNVYVDLPLQRASAHVAREFAQALGQPLTPDHLRLMFTPEFGMFIAPGCNGIRGAVTMGLIALVGGYVYRLRWWARALAVIGAVLLGYVFNLLRLCVLVVFYVIALRVPRLQDHAENADYLIGAALFFVAVYLFQQVLPQLGRGPSGSVPVEGSAAEPQRHRRSSFYGRAAAMGLLAALGVYSVVRGERSAADSSVTKLDESALGRFPQTVGRYSLVRSWNENLITGALLFHWAEYAPEHGGTHVALGISPVLGAHDTLICHTARGEDPLWRGQQTIETDRAPVSFSAAFYNDGATQFLEETTLCNGTRCGEYASPRARMGFVFSKPHAETLLRQTPERPIPILLRAETVDTTLAPDAARKELSADLTSFLSAIRLDSLTEPYRGR